MRKAIKGGNYVAMANLGLMYFNGEGVPQSYVHSYAWYSTAAAAGDYHSKGEKDIVKNRMTREQIAKGQELAAEYWEKYVVPFQKN